MSALTLGNPYLESLGVQLTHWSAERCDMEMAVQPFMANRSGRVQGGLICTLLDAVAGYAGLHSEPHEPRRHSVTLTLTTQFLDSTLEGMLQARGHLERRGRSVYFSRAEVWAGDRLLATALGTFKYMREGR